MFSDIRNDKMVDKKWRVIAKICSYLCWIIFIAILFLIGRDDLKFEHSIYRKYSDYLLGLFLIVGLALSAVHFFKPNLLGNKAQ